MELITNYYNTSIDGIEKCFTQMDKWSNEDILRTVYNHINNNYPMCMVYLSYLSKIRYGAGSSGLDIYRKTAKEKDLAKQFENIRLLLMTRDSSRIQMQCPIKDSLIMFLDGTDCVAISRLINFILHPKLGLEPYRSTVDHYNICPFVLPLPFQPKGTGPAKNLNKLIRQIYDCRNGIDISDKNIQSWYEYTLSIYWDVIDIPDTFHDDLQWVQPDISPGELIVWSGYHTTNSSTTHGPKSTIFFDYCERSLFSQQQLELMNEISIIGPVEIGAGTSRDASFTYQYNKFKDIPQGFGKDRSPLESSLTGGIDISKKYKPLFKKGDNMMNHLLERGWAVVNIKSLATSEEYQEFMDLYKKSQKEFLGFLKFHLFESELLYNDFPENILKNIKDDMNALSLNDDSTDVWKVVFGGQKAALARYNEKYFFYQRRIDGTKTHFARCGGIKLPATSGMGPASSYYSGISHLKLQTCPAMMRLARSFYSQPIMIPERYRIKTAELWKSGAHIDHHPGNTLGIDKKRKSVSNYDSYKFDMIGSPTFKDVDKLVPEEDDSCPKE